MKPSNNNNNSNSNSNHASPRTTPHIAQSKRKVGPTGTHPESLELDLQGGLNKRSQSPGVNRSGTSTPKTPPSVLASTPSPSSITGNLNTKIGNRGTIIGSPTTPVDPSSSSSSSHAPIKRIYNEAGEFQVIHVRIYFFDDRQRIIQLKDSNPRAKEVLNRLSEKEGLSPKGKKLFSLWMVGKNLELRMRPSMRLLAAVKKWPRWTEKYTHQRDSRFRFYFRREALLEKGRELRDCEGDIKTVAMLAGEARANILRGRYPCTPSEAIVLAALQLQHNSGDFNENAYRPGSYLDSLKDLIPAYLLKLRRPQDWESKLVDEYKLKGGLLPNECNLELLKTVSEWSYYGSVYFPACWTTPPDGHFERRNEHLQIGINAEGMHILDENKHALVVSESYTDLAWEKLVDCIGIEYGPRDQPIEKKLITPQYELVDDLASMAVKIIEQSMEEY